MTIASHPPTPQSPRLLEAHGLLAYGVDSVNSLADSYQRSIDARGRGAPAHVEQDLLRAMVVMAGATLDGGLKRIIVDSLGDLVAINDLARKSAEEHVLKQVLRATDSQGGPRLATALMADSPRQILTGYIIDDLTHGSLQSFEEVHRVASYLGIDSYRAPDGLREALMTRNQIIHEMDMLPPGARNRRRRRQRRRDEMYEMARVLLSVASDILRQVDSMLMQSATGL